MKKFSRLDIAAMLFIGLGFAFLVLSLASCARAEASLPFELKCPDILQCARNEPGQWVPNWYIADIAEDKARLDGAIADLAAAQDQINSFKKVDLEYKEQVEATDQIIVEYERILAERDAQLHAMSARSQRRWKWGVGATGTGALLLGVVAAGIYAIAH